MMGKAMAKILTMRTTIKTKDLSCVLFQKLLITLSASFNLPSSAATSTWPTFTATWTVRSAKLISIAKYPWVKIQALRVSMSRVTSNLRSVWAFGSPWWRSVAPWLHSVGSTCVGGWCSGVVTFSLLPTSLWVSWCLSWCRSGDGVMLAGSARVNSCQTEKTVSLAHITASRASFSSICS